MTQSEFEELNARKNQPQLAKWMREFCLNENTPKKGKSYDPKVARILSGIGTNINQIAYRLNSNRQFFPIEKTKMMDAMFKILDELKNVTRNESSNESSERSD